MHVECTVRVAPIAEQEGVTTIADEHSECMDQAVWCYVVRVLPYEQHHRDMGYVRGEIHCEDHCTACKSRLCLARSTRRACGGVLTIDHRRDPKREEGVVREMCTRSK